jgi:hypothetical protein
MQEVLSKTTDANIPLQEQEYFELRLDDLGFPFRPLWVESIGIVVQHTASLFVRLMALGLKLTAISCGRDTTLTSARPLKKRSVITNFEDLAIKDKGFIYSDIDYWGVWHGCAKSM